MRSQEDLGQAAVVPFETSEFGAVKGAAGVRLSAAPPAGSGKGVGLVRSGKGMGGVPSSSRNLQPTMPCHRALAEEGTNPGRQQHAPEANTRKEADHSGNQERAPEGNTGKEADNLESKEPAPQDNTGKEADHLESKEPAPRDNTGKEADHLASEECAPQGNTGKEADHVEGKECAPQSNTGKEANDLESKQHAPEANPAQSQPALQNEAATKMEVDDELPQALATQGHGKGGCKPGKGPSPPAHLSPGAIDRRLRRTFAPRTNGTFKVPEAALQDWQNHETRPKIKAIFEKCGYMKDLVMVSLCLPLRLL